MFNNHFFLSVVSLTLKIAIVVFPLILLIRFKFFPKNLSAGGAAGFSVALMILLNIIFFSGIGAENVGVSSPQAITAAIVVISAISYRLFRIDFTKKSVLAEDEINALKENIGKDGFTELMFYCCTERVDESKLDELIEGMKNQEVLNAQARNGNTALIYAVAHGNKDIAQSLLERGADIKIKNIKGHDVMYFANRNNDQPMINLISSYKK